jgi:hypothetical protein
VPADPDPLPVLVLPLDAPEEVEPEVEAGEVMLEDMPLEPPPHPAMAKMIAVHAHACITREI